MKLRILVGSVAVAAISVTGCAGVNDAMKYNPAVHRVQMADDSYRVFEHPDGNKLMVAPSAGASIKMGASFGMASLPKQAMEAAARKHLNGTARGHCPITSSRVILKPQYEFTFKC